MKKVLFFLFAAMLCMPAALRAQNITYVVVGNEIYAQS